MIEVEIKERASNRLWWHNLRLAPEFVTPGKTDVNDTIQSLKMPERLDGKRFLDIGTWDGGIAFEAERRGASEVVAIDIWDSPIYGGCTTGLHPCKKSFDLAHEVLDSKVYGIPMDVMDATPEKLGTFDLISMCGVLYHLKHPLLGLEKVQALCRDLLMLETLMDFMSIPTPVAAFYPGTELENDPTTWWGPNEACVKAWLLSAGFRTAELVTHRFRMGKPEQGRASFHARV
jgi:tRNA (mo5U34)-methyltransferase